MELIYSTCKNFKSRREWASDEPPICCLSSSNLVAFSTTVKHEHSTDGKSAKADTTAADHAVPDPFGGPAVKDSNPVQAKYHVYVCDLDKPWEVYHVNSYSQKVVALDWHAHGRMLLVALVTGRCQLWHMQNHLINCWQLTHDTTLPGEEVVAIKWLHLGNKVSVCAFAKKLGFHFKSLMLPVCKPMDFLDNFQIVINADKRENVKYTEKIYRMPYLPSLSHFGGRATEGWIAVASTGMVSVAMLKSSSSEVVVKSESLSYGRNRILVSAMAFDSSGDIYLVVSDGSITSAIRCYKITLKADHASCTMSCKPMASFYAKCHMDPVLRESTSARITHLDYMSRESSDILIVSAGDVNASHVELWSLKMELVALHSFYVASATPDSTFHTHRWQHRSTIPHNSLPVSIATPRFPVTYPTETDISNTMFQYVAIAYKDGSLKLVNKSSFQSMATANLDVGISDDKAEKKRKVLPYIVSMQQTFTGCCLVGMDQYSCLYLMKAVNTRDPVTQVPPSYMVGMLEYVVMTGYDWWDVLAAIKPGVLEAIVQRLSDNFSKQPTCQQEILYTRFMALKASLFRCSQGGGQMRAADCHCKLVLHSIATLFKSVLRPKALVSQDVTPAEKLSQNCSKNLDTDINKVMVTLNPEKKEFVVDPPTLQSLQQLIQWVADLVLYLLASLPMSHSYATFPGFSLLRDGAVLGTLRELLVLIRIWGLIFSNCMPHFTTVATNFDALPHMFKLLTQAWLSCKESSAGDFDEQLLDKCCILPSQVLIPPLDQGLFGSLNYDGLLLVQQFPLKYTVGEIPGHVRQSTLYTSLPDGQMMSLQKRDIVRQISLGTHPSSDVRVCARCGCYSLLKNLSKNPVIRAWELKWSKNCVCGGLWKVGKATM